MTPNTPHSVRSNYDRLAASYAEHLFHELDNKLLDRALLDQFAEQTAAVGPVCDMGCGPGHVARYLRDRSCNVFGLDLSPRMLDEARRLNPGIPFREGDLFALDLAANSLAGITAFYAIVNIPAASLPQVFRELARVLAPNGLLLLAFHIGNDTIPVTELWGQPVSMDFFLFEPSAIRPQLESAGLHIEQTIERDPYPPGVEHQTRRTYIFARKPAL
ncbi:MAG TPA: methyltransferase domain-containing protein [Acidobacteriaceae bacterium]|nr:methyltransferase domain-containing protein [Acidobacteriaceae bacterium]